MKIITIIGARPQFIKAATISRAIKDVENVHEIIVHTGQHYDDNMSAIFFEEMDIPKPHYNLGIGGGNHGEQTGEMLIGIEKVILDEKPSLVIVYGDTNSTIAGALASTKLHIPVVHVEAGLRSFNKKMPEEVNRILTDHISDTLFTPTNTAVENLKKEGIASDKIHQVGDVMYDASLFYKEKAESNSKIIEKLDLTGTDFILATVHRAENTDDRKRLCRILSELDELAKKINIVLPLHPRTKQKKEEFKIRTKNITFIDPIGYIDMVMLEKTCKMIITDSGGIQKEAFFHQKPCITLRPETEWIELVESGCNFLWTEELNLMDLYDELVIKKLNLSHNFYGKGNAAKLIIDQIIKTY
ncbi:UDP-N-acetylglucosamine 2-epimerase (non-hydrolyzing) [Aquimarina litoralis]|nr:UDP-N-acetylglucosamine 2-epimerase (non-hydrolyzing) [Aquimarina litoralis]